MLCKRFATSEKYFKNLSYLIANNGKINSFGTASITEKSSLILNKSDLKYKFFKTNTQLSKNFTSKSTINETEQKSNSSIDPDEIKKFKSLAEAWWVENGQFEALHRMNY